MPKITQQPNPYEPCYCGSGKKYKFCHLSVDSAAPSEQRVLSQAMYLDRWSQSSDHFWGQGCYSWMTSLLSPYRPGLILDVGSGNGAGLLALEAGIGSNPRIMSCDDNRRCLERAAQRLSACGIEVNLVKRLKQSDAGVEFHEMVAEPGKLLIPAHFDGVALIEADVIWDAEFIDFLISFPKFDAITVWLIGTYDLKPQCRNLKQSCEGGIYRLAVQNRVYLLADRILRVGGVLHIVDRGEVAKEEWMRQEIIGAHREQAQSTTLEVVDFQSREYEEPGNGMGITMERTVGLSGRTPDLSRLAMNSIILKKR